MCKILPLCPKTLKCAPLELGSTAYIFKMVMNNHDIDIHTNAKQIRNLYIFTDFIAISEHIVDYFIPGNMFIKVMNYPYVTF